MTEKWVRTGPGVYSWLEPVIRRRPYQRKGYRRGYREGFRRGRPPGWDDACHRCSYGPLGVRKRCPACLAPRCDCSCHGAVQPGLVDCPGCAS